MRAVDTRAKGLKIHKLKISEGFFFVAKVICSLKYHFTYNTSVWQGERKEIVIEKITEWRKDSVVFMKLKNRKKVRKS